MLDAIRKRSGSLVVKLLLGLLILSFGVWGVNDVFFPQPGRATVATVGDTTIIGVELQNEINRELTRLQRQLGSVDREQARAMGLGTQVLDRLVSQALFEQATADLGMVVSNPVVRDAIRENPAFFGGLGRFDRLAYEQILLNAGYSEDAFVQLMRRDVRRGQLMSAVTGGTAPPAALVDALYRHRNEKRVAETLLVRDADMTTPADPGDGPLLEHYQANVEPFTAPEYRRLTAAVIAVDDLAKGIEIADADLRAAFERERSRFSVPERRTVRHMVFADRAQAELARTKLAAGGEFAAVAKEMLGADPASLDLGEFTRDQAMPEMADAIFGLDKGAYSEPVQSPFGWHILQVTTVEAGSEQPFEAVRDELARSLAHERAVDEMIALSAKLEDTLADGTTIEDAGAKLNVPVISIPQGVDAAGRAPDGEAVASLPHAANFLDVAFATPQGEESRMTEGGTDSYFVVRVDGVTPPAVRPFESVRGEVLAAWQADRRKEAARALANELLQQLAGGGDLAALAAQRKLKTEVSEPMLRSTRQGGSQPQPLREIVFATDVGSFGMAEAANGIYIVRVDNILPADPATDAGGLKRMRDELKSGLEADLRVAFSEALREVYPVSINRKAVDEAF